MTNRRDFLGCMAWAGTGVLWTVTGGIASSVPIEAAAATKAGRLSPFCFVQISDTHIGFSKDPNPDPRATLREALSKIAALPQKPAFILHTGDVTQLSKPAEFDDADQILKAAGIPVFFSPGEHDLLDEGRGKAFMDRFGRDAVGDGWMSFDHGGVHFINLITVRELRGGQGHLGEAQLAWLKDDLAGRPASQPLVVFTHMPLWTVYQPWGWGTDDAEQAMSLLRPFGSVTVLNGHIHQVQQKIEGSISFHTARSTAFPQPPPGVGAPGPMQIPADQLRSAIGVRAVNVVRGAHPLALVDAALA
ncbi:MAG TPA: metallophosphoesterase [Caulobacteraceae bacterium]|nr:metallophosphoesterase [Caulobacteraceae bacterium]